MSHSWAQKNAWNHGIKQSHERNCKGWKNVRLHLSTFLCNTPSNLINQWLKLIAQLRKLRMLGGYGKPIHQDWMRNLGEGWCEDSNTWLRHNKIVWCELVTHTFRILNLWTWRNSNCHKDEECPFWVTLPFPWNPQQLEGNIIRNFVGTKKH